jgi:diguanylate cyclase (GGDEF)-like protein
VLRTMAVLLHDSVRETDVVARLGGDEFAVLLTHTSEESAASRVATLRAAVTNAACNWQGHALRVGASVGTAAYIGGDTAEMVFDRADQRLYSDKAARKGRRAR